MIERPEYFQKIKPFKNKDIIKVLTGIRRAGKSTILKMVQEDLMNEGVNFDQILSINFESGTAPKNVDDLTAIISRRFAENQGKVYFFFDEIQNLPNWEKAVNALRVDYDSDIYITGSNATLLSGELATYLTGRYIEIPVYPLSFKEVTSTLPKSSLQSRDKQDEVLEKYIRLGGFPFIWANDLDETASMNYLIDVYSSILYKDIVSGHEIRDVDLFNRIMLFFLTNISNPFSAVSLSKYMKKEHRVANPETIYNYLAYAKEAWLLLTAKREDLLGKTVLSYQEKIFLVDQGLRQAAYGNNRRDIGQVLENLVFLELLRRGFEVRIGKLGANEVDFVANKPEYKEYYQVAYLLADEKTIEREFGVYKEISDNFPKFVLSMDRIDFSHDGIIHKNVVEFLLEEK